MAYPTIFNSLASGAQPLSLFDTMFSVLGTMAVVQCTASGTNTIALAPNTNMPTQAAYATDQLYGFIAANTTTGAITINVSSLGAKNLYKIDGVTQAGSDDILSGSYYMVVYNAALNSAAGGFQIASSSGSLFVPPPQGRLTLTSNTPILTADATAQTSIYYTPYIGNVVPLYGGAGFAPITFTQLTLALDSNSGHTGYQASGSLFDLFLFLNSGVLTLGTGPAWTSTTARGTGAGTTQLTQTNGLWVNTVQITAKIDATATTVTVPASQGTYVGTMYATANGQTGVAFTPAAGAGGSNTFVGLWNAYNRVRVTSRSQDSTNNWTYTSPTWRSADNSASNRVSWIDGLQQSSVESIYQISAANFSGGGQLQVGVNFDSTSATPTGVWGQVSTSTNNNVVSFNNTPPLLGLHFAQAMEAASGATATVNANNMAIRINIDI